MATHSNNPIASRRQFGKSILGATVAGMVTAEAPASASFGPDAELLALHVQMKAAWAAEKVVHAREAGHWSDKQEADYQAAFDQTSALVDRIERLPARTIEGLQAKAYAALWCRSEFKEFYEDTSTDCRVMNSITRDLLVMMGAF